VKPRLHQGDKPRISVTTDKHVREYTSETMGEEPRRATAQPLLRGTHIRNSQIGCSATRAAATQAELQSLHVLDPSKAITAEPALLTEHGLNNRSFY